ncbi:MAG: tripartite tricarboxylate transporter substrate binding protein [Proteobacteria bacterium]|nr:tripartite tricarboxylate transporter substrate binding protein [Burkholderiales bacterium]
MAGHICARRWVALASAAGMLGVIQSVPAQERFPGRPVVVLVPSAAGGGQDVVMRLVAPPLAKLLGQPVVVENRPGASGSIATAAVVKSKPDGHTLMVTSATQGALNKHFQKPLPYDPDKDLVAVAALAAGPNVLVISAALPIRNVQELIAFAKSHPNKLTFASNGMGSGQHMVGELFNQLADVQIAHVPFKGSGEYLSQVIANNVSMGFASTLSTISLINAGRLRALGVTTRTRVDSLPDVPSIAEFKPMSEFSYVNWVGLFAPAATPSEVVSAINRAVAETLRDPVLAGALRERGNDPVIMSTGEVQEYVRQQAARITRLVVDRNIQITP